MQALTEMILLKCKKGWFSKREAVAWVGKAGAVFDGVLKRALAAAERIGCRKEDAKRKFIIE